MTNNPWVALYMSSTQHVKIPETRSWLYRVTCQQPRGGTQSRTSLSCLWQHQKTAAVPRGSRNGHPDFRQTPRHWTSTWHLYLLCLTHSQLLICFPGERAVGAAGLGKDSRGCIRVMRGCRPGSTGTPAERRLPLQRHRPVLSHLFPEKEKLVVYVSESSALGKANFTLKHSMCRPAGHGNRDNGGDKCYFFPELDLTARKKTTFKLYQENKPQFALALGVIACSSQESLVHSVRV